MLIAPGDDGADADQLSAAHEALHQSSLNSERNNLVRIDLSAVFE
jgi:hypothetical protein